MPNDDPTDETARVARAYHDAWTNRRGPEALRELMGEEFVFDSAMMHIEGREQFLAGAGANGWPERRSQRCSLRRTTATTPSSSTPPPTAARTSRSPSISSSGTGSWSPAKSSSTAPPSWHS